LAPDIVSRAAQIEALRQLPSDLIEALREIGIFRMLVPRSHGGLELDLPSALEIIRALAKIEGSVGWNAMAEETVPVRARGILIFGNQSANIGLYWRLDKRC